MNLYLNLQKRVPSNVLAMSGKNVIIIATSLLGSGTKISDDDQKIQIRKFISGKSAGISYSVG